MDNPVVLVSVEADETESVLGVTVVVLIVTIALD